MKLGTSAGGADHITIRKTAKDATRPTGQQRRILAIGGQFRATYYAPKQNALRDLQLRYLGLLCQHVAYH